MSDKEVVEDGQAHFDILVLQANLVISMPRGLSSWQKLAKPFWIDPVAYAYVATPRYLKSEQKIARGKPETELRFRQTFKSLADAYGDPFTRVIKEDRQLAPADFDTARDAEVVRRMLEWQKTVMAPAAEDEKYLEPTRLEPVLLTVPYFPLEDHGPGRTPQWLAVNKRLAAAALSQEDPSRLAVTVLVEEGLFDREAEFDRLWNDFLSLPTNHIWLWISDNDEVVEMTSTRAAHLLRIVKTANDRGKNVHQAFGGSFSSFLLSQGLTSYSHGVGYWEHKNWEPLAAGGVPTLRFFYPPLRHRLTIPEADQSLDVPPISTLREFFTDVCDCRACREVLKSDLSQFGGAYGQFATRTRIDRHGNKISYTVPLPPSLKLARRHYLEARGKEVADVLASGFDPVRTLERSVATYEAGAVKVNHLKYWKTAFSSS
jgi:hypothetical protein